VQFQNFGSSALLEQTLAQMRNNDLQLVSSRRLRAFVSIGIIETARFITNHDNVSRTVEIGTPQDLASTVTTVNAGVVQDQPIAAGLPTELGSFTGSTTVPPGLGSLHSNADLQFEGRVVVNLNRYLGDRVTGSGRLSLKDGASSLTVNDYSFNGTTWTVNTVNGTVGPTGLADTNRGEVIDGSSDLDPSGYARTVGQKTPPSILTPDPDTGELRYRTMTKDSGQVIAASGGGSINTGTLGFGKGVYVNNNADQQIGADETARANAGGAESLVYDWLNPANLMPKSGWKGPFYVPVGAYVELTADGFTITRDGAGPDAEKYWHLPDGSLPAVQKSSLHFRIGNVLVQDARGSRFQPYIVNEYTPGITNIYQANPGRTFFLRGQPFNGILFFEGNVRVRGEIPTDVQMSIISMGTVYVEGNVTKGVVGNDVTSALNQMTGNAAIDGVDSRLYAASGMPLVQARAIPSRSTILLAARDYVAVNPTMFFGPSPSSQIEAVTGSTSDSSSIRVRFDDPTKWPDFLTEFPIDPSGNPYEQGYYYFDGDGATRLPITTRLMLRHSVDVASAAATFISMTVNQVPYYFVRTATDWSDTTQSPYPPMSIFQNNLMENVPGTPTYTPIFGFGGESNQQYPNSETDGFALLDAANIQTRTQTYPTSNIVQAQMWTDLTQSPFLPQFTLYSQAGNQSTNHIQIQRSNAGDIPYDDYILSGASIVPHDVRIEATMFAENGSFFVIPGQWFNSDVGDTRNSYESKIQGFVTGGNSPADARKLADLDRLQNHGSTAFAPFYGEPLDVRIRVMGAISENLPPSMSQQAEWLRKWGWIPRQQGSLYNYAKGRAIEVPRSHLAGTSFASTGPVDLTDVNTLFSPNLTVEYDPVLATSRANGFSGGNNPFDTNSPAIRWDDYGRALPPIPRLPVSPTLAYFGEVK